MRAHGGGIERRPTAPDDSDLGKYDSDPSGDSGEEEDDEEGDEDEDGAVLVHSRQARTTLAAADVPRADALPTLAPRDVLALTLSSFDARFEEWLAEEYAGGTRVSVRHRWRDLFGGFVGAAVGGSGAAPSSLSS